MSPLRRTARRQAHNIELAAAELSNLISHGQDKPLTAARVQHYRGISTEMHRELMQLERTLLNLEDLTPEEKQHG